MVTTRETREYLANVIEEAMLDWLGQFGEQRDGDPYDGYYHDGHHVVVTNYGAYIALMVDGHEWDVTITKRRPR